MEKGVRLWSYEAKFGFSRWDTLLESLVSQIEHVYVSDYSHSWKGISGGRHSWLAFLSDGVISVLFCAVQ